MAAALHQQPVLHRLPHRLAEIDAGDRAARAGADAARLQRDGKRRTCEFLLQPRGDEADHAGMPAFGRRDDDRALVLEPERGQRLGFGLRFRRLLDDAALGVEAVEFGRDPRRFRDIAFQQQPHAEIGAPDAAAGIDARAQHEAEMPGFRRTVQPRHVHQRGMPDMVAAAHRDQALGDEGAVEPGQRRDIGHRAERDMMQHAEQIRLRPFAGPESAAAQFAIDRDQRHQHEADGGEITEAGKIVGPVRIHQRIDLGQFVAALVVIDDDDGHAELSRFRQRLEAGGAAIDRHQQRRALARQHPHGFDIGAVAFEDAVGNVDQRIEPAMAQMPGQQRRRGRAVDVVVAEDRDLLAARGRVRDALGRGFHLRHGVGIGHQFADGRIEEILDRVDLDVAARDHPRQHFRQLVALHDRQRPRRAPRIEPVAPQFSGRRLRHAEKRRRQFDGEMGCGKRHDAFSSRGPGARAISAHFRIQCQSKAACINSSRRGLRPRCAGRFAPLETEGAGNAGCALHPRSHAQCAQESARMSIQGSGEHPTFPAQWLYGL